MVAAYKTAYQQLRLTKGAASSPLYPGIREVVEALAAEEETLLGIATGKSRRGLLALLENHGWQRHFVNIQVADDHPSKPHPSMLLTALAETGLEAGQAVMIGDTTFDMEMAGAAGIPFVGGRLGVSCARPSDRRAGDRDRGGAVAGRHREGNGRGCMSEWAPKRFWKLTEVRPEGAGFTVTLDGRPVRTPAKAPLIVPSLAMAEAIAAEWDAQVETVDPREMPVTRGANAAIDKVRIQHDEVAELLAAYGDSDLLCYRADSPEALVARQAEAWDPLLDWLEEAFGVRLTVQSGVMYVAQPPAALARLRAEVHGMTDFELAGFHDLVSLSGSLVLGLAATRDLRPVEELWALSRVDETWQAEHWGVDEEAAEDEAVKRDSFLNAKRFYDAARLPG